MPLDALDFGWPVILVTVWLSCQNIRANCGGVAMLPYLGRSFCTVALDGHHDGCGCNVNSGNLTSLTILIVSQSFKACLGLLSEGSRASVGDSGIASDPPLPV